MDWLQIVSPHREEVLPESCLLQRTHEINQCAQIARRLVERASFRDRVRAGYFREQRIEETLIPYVTPLAHRALKFLAPS